MACLILTILKFAWHAGMSSTGKSFLKSLRKTPSIKEVDEEQSNELLLDDEGNRDLVIFSRDSLEPEGQSNPFSFNSAYLWIHNIQICSVCLTISICYFFFTNSVIVSGTVPTAASLNLDLLDEDDNTRFLSNLKKESSSSIDYSRPNQEKEPSTPTRTQRCLKKALSDLKTQWITRMLFAKEHLHSVLL